MNRMNNRDKAVKLVEGISGSVEDNLVLYLDDQWESGAIPLHADDAYFRNIIRLRLLQHYEEEDLSNLYDSHPFYSRIIDRFTKSRGANPGTIV